MSLFSKLLGLGKPRRIEDPAFGTLLFQAIRGHPERSYWEARWDFPPTGSTIDIGLPGDESGPREDARQFYLQISDRFERIVEIARPLLNDVFTEWLARPLADDLWEDVSLAGIQVEDLDASPIEWDVGFEARGERWLGISIPMVGETPGTPTVDT